MRVSGIYLLPSILTAANVALGYYSIMASITQRWQEAAWCILISVVVDMFDGRVARWTNSTSKFGIEFDSLADWMSFGIAPSVMMYLLMLKEYGRIGFAISFLYVICGAIRLARFNIKSFAESEPSPYFLGLPIPAAGGILASFVVLHVIWSGGGTKVRTIKLLMEQVPFFYHLLPGIVFGLSILMVSTFHYSSFKRVNIFKPKSLRAFISFIVICLMVYVYPQNTIFILFLGYICSGILEFFWRVYSMRGMRNDLQVESTDDDSFEFKEENGRF